MKKHIFTFALVAAAAIGAAVAGQKDISNAKPALSPGNCVTNVACHPGDGPSCEFNNVQYTGDDGSGSCAEQLTRDDM